MGIETLSEKDIIKTRKDHRCFACLGMIPKGSPAHVQTNSYDGIAYSLYTHPCCEEIMHESEFRKVFEYADEIPEGCVSDYLKEDMNFHGTPEEYLEDYFARP